MVIHYAPAEELQLFLHSLPQPDWNPMPRQTHYAVGGSAYFGCPSKEATIGNPFYMVRGSKYHEYYNPKIMKYIKLDAELETLHRVFLPCDKCKTGSFIFGGSIDMDVKDKKWLFDVKYPSKEKSQFEMAKDYSFQLSGYKFMREHGEHLDVETNTWIKNTGKIEHLSILAIDPITFKPRDYIMKPELESDIIKLATDFHNSRVHKIECYRPNKYCKYCRKKYVCRRNNLINQRFMPNDT